MARRMRIENIGFHHIINRGVNKENIFNSTADKEKFLEIICEVLARYNFTITKIPQFTNQILKE